VRDIAPAVLRHRLAYDDRIAVAGTGPGGCRATDHRGGTGAVNDLRAAILRGARAVPRPGSAARGTRPGDGLAFSQLRAYVEGDDPRRIDQAATARAGALQTRVYREDTALVLAAILDQSASMRVGRHRSLAQAGKEALRAWFGVAEHDDTTARIVDERVVRDRRAAPLIDAARAKPARSGAYDRAARAASRRVLLMVTDGFDLVTGTICSSAPGGASMRPFYWRAILGSKVWRCAGRCAVRDSGDRHRARADHRRARAQPVSPRDPAARGAAAGPLPGVRLAYRDPRRARWPRVAVSRFRFAGMTFLHPFWLLVGAVLTAAFAVALERGLRRGRSALLTYSELPFLVAATGARFDPARAIGAVAVIALFGFTVALAGPRADDRDPRARNRDPLRRYVRLDARDRRRAEPRPGGDRRGPDFIDAVPEGTRVGVVAFAGAAGVVAPRPATRMRYATRWRGYRCPTAARRSATRLLPRPASCPPAVGADRADHRRRQQRRLRSARRGAAAPASGIEIDTIGIGTNDSGQLIPGTGEAASLDEEALRQIAQDAHGAYARAADAVRCRGRLDALARTTTHEQKKVDLSLPVALVAGMVLLAAVAGGMLAGRFP